MLGMGFQRKGIMVDHKVGAGTGSFGLEGKDVKLALGHSENAWQYIYIVLAFAISIEGTVFSMIPPDRLSFPANVITYLVVALVTFLLTFRSRRVRRALFWFRDKLEQSVR